MNLVVGMILAICANDVNEYWIQDVHRSCEEYYTNCIVSKIYDGASEQDALKVCKDGSKTQIVK